MDSIIKTYLSEKKNDSETRKSEFEVRFTNNGKPISKLEYDDIMKHLTSLGFKSVELNGNHLLRIGVEYNNNLSLIRVEINELSDIKYLCKTGDLPSRMDVINKHRLGNYKNNDYSFTVNLAEEKKLKNSIVDTIKDQWKISKKTFRFMNRIRLYHPDIPNLYVDCSIIRSSRKNNYEMIPEITIEQSNVFNNPETYEIEIEIDNQVDNLNEIKQLISKGVKYILGGIQHTIYPISYKEIMEVEQQYSKLVKITQSRKFIGIMPKTLERSNLKSIQNDYTVTEKADGIRKLLFINDKGKMYYITRTMQIEYTGKQLESHDVKYLNNTIIDGEHVMYSKTKDYINLYACFDIYFLNNKDQRNLKFLSPGDCRLSVLKSTMEILIQYLTIQTKDFMYITEENTIFDNCHRVLTKNYIYDTDGLIFMPANGNGFVDERKSSEKCYKWKPPEHNSIDFLVMTKKDETGKDSIEYQYLNGVNMAGNELLQYKTVYLHVGFKGITNPCQNVYNDIIVERNKYNPAKFYPSNPSDEKAYICKIPLKMNHDGTMQMYSEDNEIITDKMIVEFRYIMDSDDGWSWKPTRIRWDKTFEYKHGYPSYGNDYEVANNVWRSIHYPITTEMISNGKDIDDSIDDVYYLESLVNKRTSGLSSFHNYIKGELILSTTGNNGTIIDFAVGKAGDLYKWSNNASFVLGIDLSRDCIENIIDGACVRYLQYKSNPENKTNNMKCIFLRGDSSKHIRSGKAFSTDKDFEIIKAIFGDEKPKESIGKGVIQQYNVAGMGFDVASVQFAIHYFFKSNETFYTFLQNVNESVKEGGYFIGTCYDGDTVFQLLKDKEKENGIIFGTIENKICEIIKYYDQDEFPNDERSLGYEIGVYMNTIGQVLKEYLVKFTFLVDVMQEYGFELVNGVSKSMPNSTGMFKDVYKYIEHTSKTRKMPRIGHTLTMTDDEKDLSFINRYFIFKKMRHVEKRITKTIEEPKYNIKKNKKKILIKSSNE